MTVFDFLPNFKFIYVYSYSKTQAYGKKPFFGQDVFYTHGLECTQTYIGNCSLKSWLIVWGIDLEGVKGLQWFEIFQRSQYDHICWYMVNLFKQMLGQCSILLESNDNVNWSCIREGSKIKVKIGWAKREMLKAGCYIFSNFILFESKIW